MILNHAELRIKITPEKAKEAGERLIDFAKTCEKDIFQTFATNISFNDFFSGQFVWEPDKKNLVIVKSDQ